MASRKTYLVLENYIGGQFVACSSYLDSYDPSTGEIYCKVPDSGQEEIEAAVKAAQNAFPGWSSRSPQERAKLLSKLADLIEEDQESFAQAESKDQGKGKRLWERYIQVTGSAKGTTVVPRAMNGSFNEKFIEHPSVAGNRWTLATNSLWQEFVQLKCGHGLKKKQSRFEKNDCYPIKKAARKTITFARTVDIPRAVYNFRFFSSSILHQTTECTQVDHMGCMHYTERTPVGIAGLISPWNLPLYLLTWKIAPAIACGNTVIAKPSEMTSVTAWMMCKLLNKAGFPPGVVNIVFGRGPKAGDALVCHPEVQLISFTGSTLTGQRIIERSAPYCKKLSLELGGKNPAVIFDDANLDECVPVTVRSSFANQGEICLCTSRIFVQRNIYHEFLQRFVEAVKKWKVGCPTDPAVDMGALISKEHLAKVKNYIERAKAEGAEILCGEGIDVLELPTRNQHGYFLLPTVITNIADDSSCMQDEIFGPVTCITAFDTEEEVIKRANRVKYGLSATVWSRNVGRVHRVAKRLQSGLVWTNCWLIRDLNLPFGGMKASGIGREGAKDSYEFFTEIKTITIKHTDM